MQLLHDVQLIIKIGWFIRISSLDELPHLFSVFTRRYEPDWAQTSFS